jgi:hypothetical protein
MIPGAPDESILSRLEGSERRQLAGYFGGAARLPGGVMPFMRRKSTSWP